MLKYRVSFSLFFGLMDCSEKDSQESHSSLIFKLNRKCYTIFRNENFTTNGDHFSLQELLDDFLEAFQMIFSIVRCFLKLRKHLKSDFKAKTLIINLVQTIWTLFQIEGAMVFCIHVQNCPKTTL